MTDLQQAVTRAAVAALVDTLAQVEADRYLTVDVELKNGVPVGGRSWIERGCNLGKLLGRG